MISKCSHAFTDFKRQDFIWRCWCCACSGPDHKGRWLCGGRASDLKLKTSLFLNIQTIGSPNPAQGGEGKRDWTQQEGVKGSISSGASGQQGHEKTQNTGTPPPHDLHVSSPPASRRLSAHLFRNSPSAEWGAVRNHVDPQRTVVSQDLHRSGQAAHTHTFQTHKALEGFCRVNTGTPMLCSAPVHTAVDVEVLLCAAPLYGLASSSPCLNASLWFGLLECICFPFCQSLNVSTLKSLFVWLVYLSERSH